MKAHRSQTLISFTFFLFAAVFTRAEPSVAKSESQTAMTAPLKVSLVTPSSWDIIAGKDRISSAIVAGINSSGAAFGLGHQAAQVLTPVENPSRLMPLLVLKVAQWRLEAWDTVTCTLQASLRTAEGVRNLGEYPATVRWKAGPLSSEPGLVELPTNAWQALYTSLVNALPTSPRASD